MQDIPKNRITFFFVVKAVTTAVLADATEERKENGTVSCSCVCTPLLWYCLLQQPHFAAVVQQCMNLRVYGFPSPLATSPPPKWTIPFSFPYQPGRRFLAYLGG